VSKNLLLTHNLSAKSSTKSAHLFLSSAQNFFIYCFNTFKTFSTSTHNCLAILFQVASRFLGVSFFNELPISQGFTKPFLLSIALLITLGVGVLTSGFFVGAFLIVGFLITLGVVVLSPIFIILPTLEILLILLFTELFVVLIASFIMSLEYNFFANPHLKLSLVTHFFTNNAVTTQGAHHNTADIIAVSISHNQNMLRFSFLQTD
jgi:hypothetical protein